MSFLESLDDRVLVCDGAMGSVLYERGVFVNQSFEALNLTRPGSTTRPVVTRVSGFLCPPLCRRGRRSGRGVLRHDARAHRPDEAGGG